MHPDKFIDEIHQLDARLQTAMKDFERLFPGRKCRRRQQVKQVSPSDGGFFLQFNLHMSFAISTLVKVLMCEAAPAFSWNRDRTGWKAGRFFHPGPWSRQLNIGFAARWELGRCVTCDVNASYANFAGSYRYRYWQPTCIQANCGRFLVPAGSRR